MAVAISRRDALKIGAFGTLGAAGLAVPLGGTVATKSASALSARDMPKPYAVQLAPKPAKLQPYKVDRNARGKVIKEYYSVVAREGAAKILPNHTTRVWGYNGMVPGPRIEVTKGVKVALKVRNHLPAQHPLFGHDFDISTHLHGSASKPQYDGYADDLTHVEYYKEYQYPNFQNARTLWYHDHAVHHTAMNAYTGLAAQYWLLDPLERRLLPKNQWDIPLTVTDAMFDANGQFAYDDHSHSGLWGDIILVNGQPWPVMKVQRRIYRFRVLNASIARSFRFKLSTGDPVTMVATDGGLMPTAQTVSEWRHGMAERYEVLIDFSKYQIGQRVELLNSSNENNVDYDNTGKVMAFDVVGDKYSTADPTARTLPTTLNPNNEVMSLFTDEATARRSFRLYRDDVTNLFVINGASWRDVVASGYEMIQADPAENAIEIWDFTNQSGGWFHPTHIHLVDFKVISRNGRAPFPYEMGPKDVVYVGEGESVRLLMKFSVAPEMRGQGGRYMIHCHNLPHEDHDMMQQFSVGNWQPGGIDPNDPIEADPCKYDDEPY